MYLYINCDIFMLLFIEVIVNEFGLVSMLGIVFVGASISMIEAFCEMECYCVGVVLIVDEVMWMLIGILSEFDLMYLWGGVLFVVLVLFVVEFFLYAYKLSVFTFA